MTSRMQMCSSASAIRGVLHSLHTAREQYGILIWSFRRSSAHFMQLKPPQVRVYMSHLLKELKAQE